MLIVPPGARRKILEAHDADALPLRLEHDDEGSLQLAPDDWRSGDMSYAFDGSTILLVEGELARKYEDWHLHLDEEQLPQVKLQDVT